VQWRRGRGQTARTRRPAHRYPHHLDEHSIRYDRIRGVRRGKRLRYRGVTEMHSTFLYGILITIRQTIQANRQTGRKAGRQALRGSEAQRIYPPLTLTCEEVSAVPFLEHAAHSGFCGLPVTQLSEEVQNVMHLQPRR
jgi:hypothetical protein